MNIPKIFLFIFILIILILQIIFFSTQRTTECSDKVRKNYTTDFQNFDEKNETNIDEKNEINIETYIAKTKDDRPIIIKFNYDYEIPNSNCIILANPTKYDFTLEKQVHHVKHFNTSFLWNYESEVFIIVLFISNFL